VADTIASKLASLRAPFPADEIELLPKYTGRKDANGKVPRDAYGSCRECGGYHPLPSIHLSYVGHAGITNRLLDVDPEWTWEPLALNANGTPQMADGGMWIRLTVLGVTRLGFGDAQDKKGPNATKEMIGDAIRNAAMRFGVGTYLWSKSDAAKAMLIRGIEGNTDIDEEATAKPQPAPESKPQAAVKAVSEGVLKEIHALRDELGVDAEKYLAQLRAVAGHDVASDAELSQEAAAKLLDAYEAKVATAKLAADLGAEVSE